jgi:hypothetical protein
MTAYHVAASSEYPEVSDPDQVIVALDVIVEIILLNIVIANDNRRSTT